MRLYRFYNREGRWYIDLPEFIEQGGDEAALEMVLGADDWLDKYSNGKDEVFMNFDIDPFVGWSISLNLVKDHGEELSSGQIYQAVDGADHHNMWLCDVTMWLFNGVWPDRIFVRLKEKPKL